MHSQEKPSRRCAARLARKQGKSDLADTATLLIQLARQPATLREELMLMLTFERLRSLGAMDMLGGMDMPDDFDSFGL
jgi:hypothetical protein